MSRRESLGDHDRRGGRKLHLMAALASLFDISEGQVYTVLILLVAASLLAVVGIPPTLQEKQVVDKRGYTMVVFALVSWVVAASLAFLLAIASRRAGAGREDEGTRGRPTEELR